jgi:hypothetical protein
MRIIKILLVVLAILLIVIQFIPSGIPENKPEDEKSITRSGLVSESELNLFRKSCFDCHSNQVDFPWYSKLAPSSWLLANHIKEGRSHLNFSEWADYSKRKQAGLIEHISEEVEDGSMPLKSYLLIHRDAKLNSDEISAIKKWSEDAMAKILK